MDKVEAVELLKDPNLDPRMLAAIAYEHEELGAAVAKHPQVYKDLLRWLALFGDANAVKTALSIVESAPVEQAATPPLVAPHGFSIMQSMDPNLDLNIMADIVEQAPELREYIARNRSAYPELLDWLARLDDPKINAALASRGDR